MFFQGNKNENKKYKMDLYKNKYADLTSLCPWVMMIDEGVCLIKNGVLMCAYEFIAPDVDSASNNHIASISKVFNNAVMQLGEGWAVQFELQKIPSHNYLGSSFNNLAAYYVERQRELIFTQYKTHYINKYYITFSYFLPPEIEEKSVSFFYKKQNNENKNKSMLQKQLKSFKMETGKLHGILNRYITINKLNSEELVTFMHSSVSLNWHKMKLPEEYNLFLDKIITDESLETSYPMKLGNNYIPILGIKAFPSSSIPVMFDVLNKADVPLRWSTRFIIYSQETALKRIEKAVKKFFSNRKSLMQQVFEVFTNTNSARENAGAYAQEGDANRAKVDCTRGKVGFGDYTSNIMVWDENLEIAEEKAKIIASKIGSSGFAVAEETHNALQAFLSMQPGNVFANVRKLFVSTGNMSHVVPLSSVWSGLKENVFLGKITGNNKPHLICSTNASVPFFLNLNVGDVGHHWVSGPTGAGKSTYLSLLEIQWLKYPDSQVIIFDKDLSSRCTTICVGGKYVEPGKDSIAFQPLAHIDTDEDFRWACEFIECLLTEQNVTVSAAIKTAIKEAMNLLKSNLQEDRTLTSFYGYCEYQNSFDSRNDIREALAQYLIDGIYGNLFDHVTDDIDFSFWTMFEMGTLMKMPKGAVAPTLLYLFNQCEKHFTGKPTLLILDEAWVFLKNQTFASKIEEWLKVLRKKNVFVIFATQEIDDAVKSPIATTIISQCASKVFLPDEQATTKMMKEAYTTFGLEESEINLLSRSIKKQDYFYKSPLGTRQFQLELDDLQLAILTNSVEEHKLLDEIEKENGKNSGTQLVKEVLEKKGIYIN